MSIPKHERAPSRLDAQHMARKISMEITTELARTFGYSKAYKRLVDDGRMEYREVENNFKSWICANYKFMSRQQIRNMSRLFKDLFGKDITWKKKKGHGRLRWLMGQSSKS